MFFHISGLGDKSTVMSDLFFKNLTDFFKPAFIKSADARVLTFFVPGEQVSDSLRCTRKR